MMRTLFTLLLLTLSTALSAQHWQLHAGGGLATQLRGGQVVGAYRFGVGYEHEFDQHWTIAPALLVSGKGWKDDDRLTRVIDDETGAPAVTEEGTPVYSTMGRKATATYLEAVIPINYYLRTGTARYVVLAAGPYLALGLGGNTETRGDGSAEGSAKLYYEHNTFGASGIRRFDLGLYGFAGYQFASGLSAGISADLGALRVRKSGPRNAAALVSLTYTFKTE